MKGAAEFWANRVAKQYKDDKPAMVEWSKSYIAVIDALYAYVKQWHTTGVAWNAKVGRRPRRGLTCRERQHLHLFLLLKQALHHHLLHLQLKRSHLLLLPLADNRHSLQTLIVAVLSHPVSRRSTRRK